MGSLHIIDVPETKVSQGDSTKPSIDLFSLEGRSILITGGVGALGLTVATTVLENGGDVICLDLPREPPKGSWEHLEDIRRKFKRRLLYCSCNIVDENMVEQAFAEFIPKLRFPLRGLVACAGVSEKGPSVDFRMSTFERVMQINVNGTFLVARSTAREMQRNNVDGSMILVASMSGSVVNKGVDTTAYNSSKSAVLQMARSLAAEWGARLNMPLIRVNSLSPGYIRTAATVDTLNVPGIEELWCGGNMLNRLSTVDEFRGPVLFLLSDASSFMTGADLRVDGGHCAW